MIPYKRLIAVCSILGILPSTAFSLLDPNVAPMDKGRVCRKTAEWRYAVPMQTNLRQSFVVVYVTLEGASCGLYLMHNDLPSNHWGWIGAIPLLAQGLAMGEGNSVVKLRDGKIAEIIKHKETTTDKDIAENDPAYLLLMSAYRLTKTKASLRASGERIRRIQQKTNNPKHRSYELTPMLESPHVPLSAMVPAPPDRNRVPLTAVVQ